MHWLKIQRDSCYEHFMVYNFFFFFCFPGGSAVRNLPTNTGDTGSTPGSGRSSGGGLGKPLQYCCWRISWTEKPGRLQSMGSQRVGHDLLTKQQWQQQTFFYPKGKKIINKYWILVNSLHMETLRKTCAQPISPALLPLAPPTTADSWASPAPASKQIARTAS